MRSWQKYGYLCLFLFIILPIWGVRSALAQATAAATPAPPTAELLYPNLTGAFIELTAEPMQPNLWTRLQWQDASGNWHDIEGWQGSFNPDQRVLWYIGSEQLGAGPFRWLVDESQGGERLGMSQPFNLPSRGGELLRVTVALTPEKTEEAVGSPLASTPAPDETAVPEGSYVYDNFDDPAYDGAYNSTLWSRAYGCEDAAQNDGVIAFQSSCDFLVGPASIPVEQLGLFQARVKVASDFQGAAATQEIIFSTELSTGSWWAFCGIIANADGVQKFFNVVNVGLDELDLHQTMPAEYDRWYTIRLEVDSSTMTFSCYVDEQLLGSVVPKDAEELREVQFERILEAARPPDSFATTYADDVLISLPGHPSEAGTTFAEQQPCGGPYVSGTNTLLLLSFDNHYEGTQGEMANAAGTTFTTGKFGQAVVFNGNDRLTLTTADNLSLEQGSIEFWLRPNWNGDDEQNYVFFEVGDEWPNRLRLMKDGANNLRFITWDGEIEYGVATNVTHWQAGDWHHVAASWEGTEIALFVDCVEKERVSPAHLPDVLAETIHIGAATFEVHKAEAAIDELRITSVPFGGSN
jgi:hypothetical protein